MGKPSTKTKFLYGGDLLSLTPEETYAYFFLLRMKLQNFIQMKTRQDLKQLQLSKK